MEKQFRKANKIIIATVLFILLVTACGGGSTRANPASNASDDFMFTPTSDDPGQKAAQALLGCFMSYITPIVETNDRVTDADIANGIIWKGWLRIKLIYNSGNQWEDGEFGFGQYRLFADGKVEKYIVYQQTYVGLCTTLSTNYTTTYGFSH